MGVRNAKREELKRLDCKTPDAQFKSTVRDGLNCLPFEAEAVLQVVHEVHGAALSGSDSGSVPGQVTLVAIDSDEPAGKPVAERQKQTVRLTVHRGAVDDRCLQEKKATAFGRSRIPDLCQEALSQGALLTREDLAYRIFFVSPRTISGDLEWLRKAERNRPIPLRSMVHDMGPVLTHRTQIVRLALEGKTTSQICQIMRHWSMAVANYLSTFTFTSGGVLRLVGGPPGTLLIYPARFNGLDYRMMERGWSWRALQTSPIRTGLAARLRRESPVNGPDQHSLVHRYWQCSSEPPQTKAPGLHVLPG